MYLVVNAATIKLVMYFVDDQRGLTSQLYKKVTFTSAFMLFLE